MFVGQSAWLASFLEMVASLISDRYGGAADLTAELGVPQESVEATKVGTVALVGGVHVCGEGFQRGPRDGEEMCSGRLTLGHGVAQPNESTGPKGARCR